MKFTRRPILIFAVAIILFISLIGFVSSDNSAFGEEILKDHYSISRSKIDRTVALGTLFQDFITVENLNSQPISVGFSVSGQAADSIEFDYSGIEVLPKNSSSFYFYIKGLEIGNYSGELSLSGGITEKIPINLKIVDADLSPLFFVDSEPFKKTFNLNEGLRFKIYLNRIKSGTIGNLTLKYYLNNSNNESFFLGEESFNFTSSFYLVRKFDIPEKADKGDYILETVAIYSGESITSLSQFIIRKPFFSRIIFGFLPLWALFLGLGIILLFLIIYFLVKRHIRLSKKYRMELDIKKLPLPSKEVLVLGKVAETKIKACLEPEKLKTHTIFAGATGGGKRTVELPV